MTDLNSIPALEEDELSTLAQLLEREADANDSFDFFAVHGFVTAMCVGPNEFHSKIVWQGAFDSMDGFSADELKTLEQLVNKLEREIQAWLDSGQDFPVPCELTLVDDDEPMLESWAMGFMSAVLLQEAEWYANDEQQMAQFLFPIMYASGLFMDEPEMADIDEDADLSDKVCATIPAVITEMYLQLHSTH